MMEFGNQSQLETMQKTLLRLRETASSIQDCAAVAREQISQSQSILERTRAQCSLASEISPLAMGVILSDRSSDRSSIHDASRSMDIVARLLMEAHGALPRGQKVLLTLIEMAMVEIGRIGAEQIRQEALASEHH